MDREVKLVIIGFPGGSGTSWTTNSTISRDGLSLTVQEYSPLSPTWTGFMWRLKLFAFKNIYGEMEEKREKMDEITMSFDFRLHLPSHSFPAAEASAVAYPLA